MRIGRIERKGDVRRCEEREERRGEGGEVRRGTER